MIPGTVRIGSKIAKGYRLEQFLDAFARYLPENPPSYPLHGYGRAQERLVTDLRSVTDGGVLRIANPLQPSIGAACNGVTNENPLLEESGEDSDSEAAV